MDDDRPGAQLLSASYHADGTMEPENESEKRPLKDQNSNKRPYGTNVLTGSPRRRVLRWWERVQKMIVDWKLSREREVPDRTIHINNPEENKKKTFCSNKSKFCSNKISTTKYNVFSFIFLFLFDQFRRYANLFFLFIVILQQIPGVSPTGRFTTLVPLTLILIAVAIKELIEDVRRAIADNRVNRSKVQVIREGRLHWVYWTKVVVGDIVKVENKHFFPADLLLLSSSEPLGICYVETSNLDGETNLKIRQSHTSTADCEGSIQALSDLKGHVECEGPNKRLYEFTGNLQLESAEKQPIQSDQILLRGAQLRNTEWIYGLVIYSGHDSKLLQNASRAPLKRSRLDHVTNKQVILLFGVLLFLAFISSIGALIWNDIHLKRQDHWYLDIATDSRSAAGLFFLSILTFTILYNNLVPISLIVTLEIVKFVQSFFINYDLDLYDPVTDTPALARNSNLNEELGQVQYVFSDKTGTLTENLMEFKKCSVAGQIYGLEPSSSSEESYTCLDLREALRGLKASDDNAVLEFFKVLALCHSVIPEREGGSIVYRASSPDEEALVKAARELGVVFTTRTPDYVVINVCGVEEKYEVLNLLEFNSTRKRMSVVVRTPKGEIKLLCKGADSVIYPRLVDGEPFARETEGQLEYFAVDGLRTLCIAQATIDKTYYEEWASKYYKASTALKDKESMLDNVAEEIEKDLHLLGATAIEDKLQQGVPESIATLRQAGIRVWVLTGDKQETAINIGFASRQLTQDMELLVINDTTLTAVETRLNEYLSRYNSKALEQEINAAVIIDGKALAFALDARVQDSFLKLTLACKSVICCRVSPSQKADVVRMVKAKVKDSITLAIGDGANDVSMIQAAHVGVGISGREGLQATLASDYAIAQFRFLVKLLLVHGVWNYNRLAIVTLFSFYKNICLYIIEFWFAFLNGFSGQPLFERWTLGLFNVLFTAVSPFSYGLLEQDVSAGGRMTHPHLYKTSQQGKYFNTKIFWKWVGLAIYHSLLLYFGIYFILKGEVPFETGKVVGLWYVGNTVYTSVVVTVNIKLALESQYWTWIHHLTVWGSIIMWFLYVAVYSHFWPTFPVAVEMVGQEVSLYSSFTFYYLFILAPFVATLPDFIKTVFQKIFCPTDADRVRTAEIKADKKSLDYERLNEVEMSVRYSKKADKGGYGDGLDEHGESPLRFGPPSGDTSFRHGYAFSQEDHGITRKGSRLQRREVIRMYDTGRAT